MLYCRRFCLNIIHFTIKMKLILVLFSVILAYVAAYENSDIVSGRIESCQGCSLNRLPKVKAFIMDDAPTYERMEVKFISGARPELILLGEGDRELERLPLSDLDRDQCNKLLEEKGFTKKSRADL